MYDDREPERGALAKFVAAALVTGALGLGASILSHPVPGPVKNPQRLEAERRGAGPAPAMWRRATEPAERNDASDLDRELDRDPEP